SLIASLATLPSMSLIPFAPFASSRYYSNPADTATATEFGRLGFVWLFFAMRLSLRSRAISATHLRILPTHLSITRSHLWIMRHLIHRMRLAGTTSGSGHFAGVHFCLASAHVAPVPLISC